MERVSSLLYFTLGRTACSLFLFCLYFPPREAVQVYVRVTNDVTATQVRGRYAPA